MNRAEELKRKYNLTSHPEGGWFSEVYTSPSASGGRAFTGSIYYLLEGNDVSHFHQIDCDEIWYHHEGGAMKITMIVVAEGSGTGSSSQGSPGTWTVRETFLGAGEGETAMVVIPAGAVFAAELIDKESYCFTSCVTTPKFTYDGFRLLGRDEIKALCPSEFDRLAYLAVEG